MSTNFKDNQKVQKLQPYLAKINAMDKRIKIVAASFVFLVVGFALFSGSNYSKAVENLIWEEANNQQNNGFIDMELHKVNCAATKHDKAKHQAYKCDATVTVTEGLMNTKVTETTSIVMDYDPKTDKIVNSYQL